MFLENDVGKSIEYSMAAPTVVGSASYQLKMLECQMFVQDHVSASLLETPHSDAIFSSPDLDGKFLTLFWHICISISQGSLK